MKVLIVEDEAISALYTQSCLEELGYEVCTLASNENEATEVCAHEHPDIILMDINLSGKNNGITLAKSLFETYKVGSVFISGYPQSDFVKELNGGFFRGYLQKPYLMPKLNATLVQLSTNR